MKKVFFTTCFLCLAFIACNSVSSQRKESISDTVKTSTGNIPKPDSLTNNATQKEVVNNNSIRDKILGIWAFVGDENATFVIDKDKITYPDQNASYKYFLTNDSLHIKFDGYDGNYLVKARGADTLVLVGDEQQVYYRFKK